MQTAFATDRIRPPAALPLGCLCSESEARSIGVYNAILTCCFAILPRMAGTLPFGWWTKASATTRPIIEP